MVSVLYLVHDFDDSAIWRRVSMLEAGGATVTLAGFRRGKVTLSRPVLVLGKTSNARMVQRIGAVGRAILSAKKSFRDVPRPDVILARNLEMLALARRVQTLWPGQQKPGLVYEVLDIHRMMLGDGLRARVLRGVERAMARRIGLLLTSSPGFLRSYFTAYGQIAPTSPVHLVENKLNGFDLAPLADHVATARTVPTIGWFGILRCNASLALLDEVTRADPGRLKVVLSGRPALDEIPDFHAIVDSNPDLDFQGPYRNPDDLPRLYGSVDLAWLIDRYDAGQNSDWLLPNRLYEGCRYGAVPLALAGTEVARRLDALGIGVVLPGLTAQGLVAGVTTLSRDDVRAKAALVAAVPQDQWTATRTDAVNLVRMLEQAATKGVAATNTLPTPTIRTPRPDSVLIVIPTLNEAAHIAAVIDSLLPFALARRARIVVADGGSSDGTKDIVTARTDAGQPVTLMHNPARLQAAGINLAVAMFGTAKDWLIRIDAHADYPADYCETLIAEAEKHGADSVVVGMEAVGQGLWQSAVAAAQNSRFGNGGAAHRIAPVGRFVDHGHHALMRMSMFTAVGGYDETFSHNEDAELDLRLRQAGGRIWLTAETRLAYFPRRSLDGLLRQYFRFGRGRAQNILKHKSRPGARQMLVIALAPALALGVLAPVSWVFALPLLIWAAACIFAGAMIARSTGDLRSMLAGLAAGAMHAAWSAGFWTRLVSMPRPPARPEVKT
jgi:GT2 family glycosyltransferase